MGAWDEVVVVGWIGESPQGGEDAFLLAYPAGTGPVDPAPAMADLIRELGMIAGRLADVPGLSATLTSGEVEVSYLGTLLFARPTSHEWDEIARSRRRVVFAIGTAPVNGNMETYLASTPPGVRSLSSR